MAKTAANIPRGKSFVWLQGLACGALLTFAAPMAVLGAALMAPAVFAWLADTRAGKPVARTVAISVLAPSLGPIWHLWIRGGRLETALALLGDPQSIGLAWFAGACGWALCQVLPVALGTMRELQEAGRAAAMRSELAAQKLEWDPETGP